MKSLSTDAELLARSVDQPALFGELYERHGLPVRLYAARRVGADTGDDVASEVFIRAFDARDSYRAVRDVALPWLLGIANDVIADHRRLERRRFAALERVTREAHDRLEQHDMVLEEVLPHRAPPDRHDSVTGLGVMSSATDG